MRLLENEKVKEYFGCKDCAHKNIHECRWEMSFWILNAMQQPIRKGDRILIGSNWRKIEESHWTFDDNSGANGPIMLRLPDKFQRKESDGMKCGCGLTWKTHHRFDGPCYVFENMPQPTDIYKDCKRDHLHSGLCFFYSEAVEEKIKEIVHEFKWSGTPTARKYEALRELVRIAWLG